jgi:hypothetical protein
MSEHGGSSGSSGVLRELLAIFSFGVDTEELKEGENKLEEFLGKLQKVAAGVAAAFAAKEIYEFAEGQVRLMTQIEHTASALGISTEKVQEFQFAAKSMGMESEQLLNLMGRLQVQQQGAASGNAAAAKAFGDLHTSVKGANGEFKQADELFLDVADGIAGLKDPSKQAALATELFGRQGRALLPFLKEGRKGVEELADDFRQLGGGYSEKAIKEGQKFEKQNARLGLSFTGVKNTILIGLLPVLTRITSVMVSAVKWFNEMTRSSNVVQAVLIALGAAATVFAIKMAIAASPILLIAAAIGALILIIDDLYTFLTGGESEIGDLIDQIWGKGRSVEVIKELRDYWQDLGEGIKIAWEYIKKFAEVYFQIWQTLGDFAGKVHNFVIETKSKITGDDKRGRGGMTVEERAIANSAKQYLAAQQRGEEDMTPESYLTVPKGMSRGEAMTARMNAIDALRADLANGVQVAGLSNGGQTINNAVNVQVTAGPGMDPKQIGEHVADQVDQRLRQHTRAAAATLQRAPAQ